MRVRLISLEFIEVMLFFIISPVLADESDLRWFYLGHKEDCDIYYDKQTATYDPNTRTIMMWEGQVLSKQIVYLEQYYIFLDTHKHQLTKRTIHNLRTGLKNNRNYLL